MPKEQSPKKYTMALDPLSSNLNNLVLKQRRPKFMSAI